MPKAPGLLQRIGGIFHRHQCELSLVLRDLFKWQDRSLRPVRVGARLWIMELFHNPHKSSGICFGNMKVVVCIENPRVTVKMPI